MIKIIAEIGINHNGDIDICKKLIMLAKVAGCDYAKIQKRTPRICVPEEQKGQIKDTPWGKMTYLEYKEKIEFNEDQIRELISFAKTIGIELFASVWDKESVDLMAKYSKISKIPSALVTSDELCAYARAKFEVLMVSTGMCTESEVVNIKKHNPNIVFHTNSQYPSNIDNLNLNYIHHLAQLFNTSSVGYSGHEISLAPTFAAVALGAQYIERHVTLDKTMWGSDQTSSLSPNELFDLVKGCHEAYRALGVQSEVRKLYDSELGKRKTLRGM